MVKSKGGPDVRPEPAANPAEYKHFSDWLRVSLEFKGLRGLQGSLAKYCEVSATHVMKWKTKSVPGIPTLRKVAVWAQVDYDALKSIADAQLEDRANAVKEKVKPAPFKRSLKLVPRPLKNH